MTNQIEKPEAHTAGKPDAELIERLARYMDPSSFVSRRRSSRNAWAARNARKYALKQAKAAIRFLSKPKTGFLPPPVPEGLNPDAIADAVAALRALYSAVAHMDASMEDGINVQGAASGLVGAQDNARDALLKLEAQS